MQRRNPTQRFELARTLALVSLTLCVLYATTATNAQANQPADWGQQADGYSDDYDHHDHDDENGRGEDPEGLAGTNASSYRRFYASAGFGFDFSRGDYGEPDKTNTLSIPLFVKLEYEPITVKVLVPAIFIDGSQGVIAGEGLGTAGGTDRRWGIGDVVTSLAYTWFPKRDNLPIVDLSTKFKLPTASASKGIGTGKFDLTFQIEAYQTIGRVSFFAGSGYRLKGGFYNNVWLASVGSSLRLGSRASIGVAYDFREGSTDTSGDSHELSPYASFRLGSHFRLSPYFVIGLSQNTPDWGAGTTFTFDF